MIYIASYIKDTFHPRGEWLSAEEVIGIRKCETAGILLDSQCNEIDPDPIRRQSRVNQTITKDRKADLVARARSMSAAYPLYRPSTQWFIIASTSFVYQSTSLFNTWWFIDLSTDPASCFFNLFYLFWLCSDTTGFITPIVTLIQFRGEKYGDRQTWGGIHFHIGDVREG